MQRTIEVVAFDLDDTLIRLSPDFVPEYLKRLAERLESVFPKAGSIASAILDTSQLMMEKTRDPERLEDFFYRDFEQRTGLARTALEPHLTAFYDEEFPALESLSRPVYGVMGLLAGVRARGFRVALLTSALFPRRAIDARLRWAGLEDFPFDWRTSLEVVHATKPQPGFYLEAADGAPYPPDQWLMVGNDLVEDVVPAHEAGMHVYWVHGDVTPDEEKRLPPDVAVGPLERVIPWLDRHAAN